MPVHQTVADLIGDFLFAQGVRRVYGITGGEVLALIDALQTRGIEFILTHHEAAAAYMADTEGQLSGRPGVCVSTLGPGAANLFAGLAQATLEGSPVLGITADVTDDERAGLSHQVMDICGAMGTVTKSSAMVTPESVWTALPHAWTSALSGRPGAAHLSVPASVAGGPARAGTWATVDPPAAPELDPAAVEAVREDLLRARAPAAVLGPRARAPNIAAAFRELAETLDLPVVTQIKAKGWFPGDHPLHAGTLANYGSRGARQLLAGADFVLGAGLDGPDLLREWPGPEAVHLTPEAIPDRAIPQSPVVGPVASMLRMLSDSARVERTPSGSERARAARRQALADLDAHDVSSLDRPGSTPGRPPIHALFTRLRAALDPDAALISDVGVHKLYLAQYWPVPKPDGFLVANGLSAMGGALPGAIAYKLERPDRPLVAVAGDGGLLMYAGELETLARLAPALVYVVLRDDTLALIRMKAEEREMDPRPNDFRSIDYVGLARSFGLAADRADTPDRFVELVRAGLGRDGPSVVEAPVDYGAYRRMA